MTGVEEPLDPAGPYERYWDALADLRAWRAPFFVGVDAGRRAEAEATELCAQAAKLAGQALPIAPLGVSDAVEPAGALEALRARVADLRLLSDVIALWETVAAWVERAGLPIAAGSGRPDADAGPFAAWAAGARARMTEIGGWISAATPAGLTAAREQLDVLLRGIEGVRRALLDQVDTNRTAAGEVVIAYEEACHLVLQDVAALHGRLGAVGRGEQGESTRILLFMGVAALVGAVSGLAYVYVREANAVLIPAVAGGVLVGLGLGLGMWVWRLRTRSRRIQEILTDGRELLKDAGAAQLQVRSELEALQRAAHGLADAARALRTEISAPDHTRLLAQVDVPAETDELRMLIARAETLARPDVPALAVAATVFTFMLGLVGVIFWGPQGTVDPGSPPPGSVPALVAPAAPAGTGATPSAAESASARAAPAEAAPALRSGDWTGTLGPLQLSGVLTVAGSTVTGQMTISGPDGTQSCAARGSVSGTRLTLSLPDCPQHASLSGKIAKGGTRITGSGKSTVTFQGQTTVAEDVWEMKAR